MCLNSVYKGVLFVILVKSKGCMKALIQKHFPFKEFNAGQYEVIDQTLTALLSGTKHVVIEAPTGIGKSAIATTIHRVLREKTLGHRTTIITATKGLQDQYEREDNTIVSLKGRTNYPCILSAGHYNTPQCKALVAENNCSKTVICTYFKTREKWRNDAELRLTNTSFQITAPHSLIGESITRANLLVIDECHSIDEQLVTHSTLKIDVTELSSITKVAGKDYTGVFVDYINGFMELDVGTAFHPSPDQIKLAFLLATNIESKVTELTDRAKTLKVGKDSVLAVADELASYKDNVLAFASGIGEWILTDFAYAGKVELKPVYAYQVAKKSLFDKCDQFIHMSATICGYDEYISSLGIDPSTSTYISVQNPIPVESRVVHSLAFMKVSRDYDRGRMASIVDKIITRHKKENGIIHSVSFQLAKDLQEYSAFGDRMLISNNRDEILERLEKHNSGAIIVSPSIEQGYDFKGDMSRWQIIAKIPYGYIGDAWIKLNMDRSPKWYARKAILRTVQSCGRSVRGIDDWATTYIIDENFERLLKQNQDLFPEWFIESVQTKK